MRGGKGFAPASIRAMTIPEIALALDDDFEAPRPPAGERVFRFPGERDAWVTWWRNLDARGRLEHLRAKYGYEATGNVR